MLQNNSKVVASSSVHLERRSNQNPIIKIFCAIILALQLIVTTSPVKATSCDDVRFIFARGSGEQLSGPSATAWKDTLTTKVSKTSLSYSFYELGSKSWGGAQYPAVAVSGSLGAIGNLVGAYITAGSAFEFGRSVEEGERELKAYLKTISSSCPNTKFVLGGYSQGAMLISHILSELDSSKIIYVANFGDPKLYLPEGKGLNPDACRGRNLSNYRAYVSDCRAYEGVLGSYRPYQPNGYYNKIGVWCHGKDIMCSSGFNIADHSSYVSRGLYLNAAEQIYQKLQSAFPNQVDHEQGETTAASSHDLAIFINTNGFDPVRVGQFTNEARQLADSTRAMGGRVALYVYADRGKLLPQELCNFSCSKEEFEHQLTLVNTKFLVAGGGMDSGLSALKMSMEQLEWQVGATKSAVIFTPSKIAAVDRDGTTIDEVVELSLNLDPVNVYSFITANSTSNTNQILADATGGRVYTFQEDNKVAYQEILSRPVAELALEEYFGVVGEEFYFDASGSHLLDSDIEAKYDVQSVALRYDWDLDADGIFEIKNSTSSITKNYDQPIEGFIQVRVTDPAGHASNMSARIQVVEALPASALIQSLSAVEVTTNTYQISFKTQDTDFLLIALNDAIYGRLDTKTEQNIIIHDVEKVTNVSLVPYNSSGSRGETKSIQIGKNQNLDKDESVSGPSEEFPKSPDDDDAENLGSSSSNNTSSETIRPDQPNHGNQSNDSSSINEATKLIPSNQQIVLIPKVPNTGIMPYYRELKCQ